MERAGFLVFTRTTVNHVSREGTIMSHGCVVLLTEQGLLMLSCRGLTDTQHLRRLKREHWLTLEPGSAHLFEVLEWAGESLRKRESAPRLDQSRVLQNSGCTSCFSEGKTPVVDQVVSLPPTQSQLCLLPCLEPCGPSVSCPVLVWLLGPFPCPGTWKPWQWKARNRTYSVHCGVVASL